MVVALRDLMEWNAQLGEWGGPAWQRAKAALIKGEKAL